MHTADGSIIAAEVPLVIVSGLDELFVEKTPDAWTPVGRTHNPEYDLNLTGQILKQAPEHRLYTLYPNNPGRLALVQAEVDAWVKDITARPYTPGSDKTTMISERGRMENIERILKYGR